MTRPRPELTIKGATSAIHNRVRCSRWLNRTVVGLAIGAGVALAFSSGEDTPPARYELGVGAFLLVGSLAVAYDSRLLKKNCEQTVKDYAEANYYNGDPQIRTILAIYGDQLSESTDFNEGAEPSYRTEGSRVEKFIAKYGTSYVLGSGAELITRIAINHNALTTAASADAPTSIVNAAIASIITGAGMMGVIESELWYSGYEAAYLEQLNNIDSAGTIEL